MPVFCAALSKSSPLLQKASLPAQPLAHLASLHTYRFHLHVGLNTIGLILSLSSCILAIIKLKTADKHRAFGIVATVLALVQPLNAVVRPLEPKAGEKKSVWRVVWEQTHHWNGRAALAFAAAAVFTGIDLGARRGAYVNALKWKRAFGGLLLALVFVWAALFAWHRFRLRKQRRAARRELEQWPPAR
jgi:hypothetical protein